MGNRTTKGIKFIKNLKNDHIIKTLLARIDREEGNLVITLDDMDMIKCVLVSKNKLDLKTGAKKSIEREFIFNQNEKNLVENITKTVSDAWTLFLNENLVGIFAVTQDIVELSN